jgi:hypothetical protein
MFIFAFGGTRSIQGAYSPVLSRVRAELAGELSLALYKGFNL